MRFTAYPSAVYLPPMTDIATLLISYPVFRITMSSICALSVSDSDSTFSDTSTASSLIVTMASLYPFAARTVSTSVSFSMVCYDDEKGFKLEREQIQL